MRRLHSKVRAEVRGTWHVVRQIRRTGSCKRQLMGRNTVPTEGLDLILDIMRGQSQAYADGPGSNQSGTGAVLDVDVSSGSTTMSGETCVSGYPQNDTGTVPDSVVWRWEDISADTYTISAIRMRQGSDTGTIFSEKTSNFFGDSDPDKPSSENWFYELRFDVTGSGTDNFIQAGLNEIPRMVANIHPDRFDGSVQLITGDISAGNENNPVGQSSTPPSRTNETVTYEFTSTAGNNDTYDWEDVLLRAGPWTSGDEDWSNDEGVGHGPKSSNEEWQYTYDFTLASA